PRNTSASMLIALLPELLQRPGTYILSNYDIQVEGMSVETASDVALNELQIVDIEKIEVSESPLSSYQKNGQGGSINFVLRQVDACSNPHGSVGLTATSETDLAPQFGIGYKRGKFMLRGIVLGELYDTSKDTRTLEYDDRQLLSQSHANEDIEFRTELARAYMQYDVSERDVIQFNLSEIHAFDKSRTVIDFTDETAVSQCRKSTSLQAYLKYQHNSTHGTFSAQAEYKYTPSHKDYNIAGQYQYDGKVKANNVSGKLEYKAQLFNKTYTSGRRAQCEMTIGSNFNTNFGDETTSIIDKAAMKEPTVTLTPQSKTYYIMPYMVLTGTVGRLKVKATGESQHYRYDIDYPNHPYSATSNDFTGKLMAEWHFSESKNLRLILDRKLQRPTAEQLYPYRLFSPERREYVEGNPHLQPMMVHEVMLDYIGSYCWDSFHKLTFNAGVSYNRITDILHDIYSDHGSALASIGLVQRYLLFENSGSDKIACANLMALYSHKAFSLSLTGNVYHKMLGSNSGDDHYTYYNISIYPHFNLKDGWNGGARLVYFSRVGQNDGSIGDSAVANMTVGKAWKRFFVFLTENVSVTRDCKDVSTTDTKRTEKRYQIIQNNIEVGMKYSF
ncbi:MAG: hypothetical protein Q4E55_06870, partial [Bacteroidales bacterium]|nr:hypothetical protein [Bacteroidales bacterium]